MGIEDKLEPLTGEVFQLTQSFQGDDATAWTVHAGRGSFILKTVRPGHDPDGLRREQVVLANLPRDTALELPRPVGLFEFEGVIYGLQTCLEGQNLVHALRQADEPNRHLLVRSWGHALREIHRWQPTLAFRESPLESFEITRRQTPKDTVIEHGPFRGWMAQAVLDELEAARHLIQPRIVFTHWDYCVPNALAQGKKVSAIVDWCTGRYADYRSDLAAASWSLQYNLGSRDYLPSLLEGYRYSGTLEELRWFEGLWALPV